MQIQKIDINDLSDEEILTSRKFDNANDFSKYIETRAYQEDLALMETLLQYADEEDIEPEAMAKLINKSLKEKIQYEAEEACLLMKTTTRLTF